MFLKKVDGPRAVTLPDGSVLTVADLPPPAPPIADPLPMVPVIDTSGGVSP